MFLNFEKWHGCKNDFIVTWVADTDGDVVVNSLQRQASALCDRTGAGIGADGLLLLHVERRGDLTPKRLTIINSDGSTARTCGNGLRCAALSVLRMHRDKGNPRDLPEAVEFLVEEKSISCRFIPGIGSAKMPFVAVEMGEAKLGNDVPWKDSAKLEVERVARDLGIPALTQDYAVCEIGNPHLVFFLDKVDRAMILRVGPALQKSQYWDGMNVHLVQTEDVSDRDQSLAKNTLGQSISEKFRAFVWERGAGETQACGSGACAIVACAFDAGTTSRDEWVAVDMPGGRLYVQQENESDPVVLAGPGELVFEGKIEV